MEKIVNIGRLRTTINGIADSITLEAASPLTLDINDNHFKYGLQEATATNSGYLSSIDKRKLDSVAFNATDNIGTLTAVRIDGIELTNSGVVDLPIANTNQLGLTKLSNSTSSDSEDTAATSKALKAVWDMAELKTSNKGTITEIILNGESMGNYGPVDLGTVVREHQDISGKVDKIEGKGLSTNDFTNEYKGLVETALQEHQDLSHKVETSTVGVPNGLATLDSDGMVPLSQLRSYTINVVEAETIAAFPQPGESQKIYIATRSRLIYRWNGSSYEEISESLHLGETAATSYRGDRGKAAYNHSLVQSGNPHHVTKEEVGLGNVPDVTTNNQIPTYTESDSLTALQSGETLSTLLSKLAKVTSTVIEDTETLSNHLSDTSNPHSVSKNQIGLGSVQNYDQSKAITSIVRKGSVLEATNLDGSVSKFISNGNNANYSEVFEWADQNINNEDRNGYFVTSVGEKIRIANNGSEYLLGVVTDDAIQPGAANVGIIGKMDCVDDGTCEVDGYVGVKEGGIATASSLPSKYRMMKRIDPTHITIFISPTITIEGDDVALGFASAISFEIDDDGYLWFKINSDS